MRIFIEQHHSWERCIALPGCGAVLGGVLFGDKNLQHAQSVCLRLGVAVAQPPPWVLSLQSLKCYRKTFSRSVSRQFMHLLSCTVHHRSTLRFEHPSTFILAALQRDEAVNTRTVSRAGRIPTASLCELLPVLQCLRGSKPSSPCLQLELVSTQRFTNQVPASPSERRMRSVQWGLFLQLVIEQELCSRGVACSAGEFETVHFEIIHSSSCRSLPPFPLFATELGFPVFPRTVTLLVTTQEVIPKVFSSPLKG